MVRWRIGPATELWRGYAGVGIRAGGHENLVSLLTQTFAAVKVQVEMITESLNWNFAVTAPLSLQFLGEGRKGSYLERMSLMKNDEFAEVDKGDDESVSLLITASIITRKLHNETNRAIHETVIGRSEKREVPSSVIDCHMQLVERRNSCANTFIEAERLTI